MSGWKPRDPSLLGLHPAGYDDGQVPVKDASGVFVPGAGGGGGADLSDADPQPVGTATPGTSEDAARADHAHALGPLDSLVLVSPDGTLWDFTVDNGGALTTTGTEIDARATDQGFRVTDEGLRTVENV